MMPDVCVVACPDYQIDNVRRALDDLLRPINGLDWVQPGMKIVLKANLVTAMKPETAAVTHPAVLTALTQMLVEKGAKVIIGDSPGGPYTGAWLSRVYHAAGLAQAEQAGAVLNHDFSQITVQNPQAQQAKEFACTGYLLQADAIINVSKLKSHGMMGLSAAVKNMFGAIPGTQKPEYHFKYATPLHFAQMIIDLNEYLKPRLCITDAVVAMEGNGPTKGSPRQVGALLASFSPYHLDLAAAKILGLTPKEVPTLEAALSRGFAPETADALSVCGDLSQFIVPDFHRIVNRNSLLFGEDEPGITGKFLSWGARTFLAATPALGKTPCIGCEKCREICPAHAITMKRHRPQIHRKACIRCFCCQEFCPAGAMVVRRTPVARLLNR